MSDTRQSPEREAVSRLFDLSRSGEFENFEFMQLGRQVFDSMLETYREPSLDTESESIS